MAMPHITPAYEGFAAAAGVRFHYVRYDPPGGAAGAVPTPRPILLLHGFPQTLFEWRLVAGPLAAATGRVVYAIDTKGNGASDKPRPDRRTPRGRYDLARLAYELRTLLTVLDIVPAVVVGHDWGGPQAALLAGRYPDAVARLVLIDGPTLTPRNLLRMAYAFGFQIPRLPEWIFRRGGVAQMVRGLNTLRRGGKFTEREARVYYEPLAAPGGIEAALAYYRSAVRNIRIQQEGRRRGIHVPTLLIWGDSDPPLPLEVPRRMLRYIPGGALAILKDTGHWVPEERPTETVRLITDFLADDPPPHRGRLIWTVE
jgi:pimeloyl-ACP methyl ester carboxylesterase